MTSDRELRNFTDKQGRVTVWPAKPFKQLIVLKYLASHFVLGKRYSEAEINELLGEYHTFGDPALLRRELIVRDLFDRTEDGSEYWKKEERER
jgi:hypothetical protein